MNISDMLILAFANLFRTKLRTFLTVLGVIIGIGALSSMVSFGTGMEKNITDAFKKNDLFTSFTVTAKKIDLEQLSEGNIEDFGKILEKPNTPLTDSILEKIQGIPGVETAFPDILFPSKLKIDEYWETNTNVQAVPAKMGNYQPFNDLLAGEFFKDDSSNSVVIRWETLKRMNLFIQDENNSVSLTREDSLHGAKIVHPDTLIGKSIQIISKSIKRSGRPFNPLTLVMSSAGDPFNETVTELTICGILKRSDPFTNIRFRGGIIIPTKTAGAIPKLGFSSIWELFDKKQKGTYNSFYVRVKKMENMNFVRKEIEEMEIHAYSVSDQLKEIKRGLIIIDSLLGAIGTVALIIAALGIINTMVMSILERTREIGIMKAIGGSEKEIKLIFFVEAGFIGVIGAIFGLILGWLVTRIANQIVNAKLIPQDELPVDLFYFPLWLLLGATAFSILISLAAGLYPAIRAARIDPVKALRHD